MDEDWEIIESTTVSIINSTPDSNHSSDEIDSAGLVQVNYFSLDTHNRRRLAEEQNFSDDNSIESDNPSWIDPGLVDSPTRYLHKDSGEFWSDSSSERSEDRKSYDYNDVGFEGGGGRTEVGFGGIEKKGEKVEALGGFCSDSAEGEENGMSKRSEGDKKVVMWWKMPVELLKYCVFRMSPVWGVSVAAAVMGLVILGRRLYKMKKKKVRGLEVKITVDDKKVSQVMTRAARLNDAFSVVKRVPIIRPLLPTVGVNTWPVMNLR